MCEKSPPSSLLRNGDTAFCPHYHRAVEIIGRRWAGAIVRALLAGMTRFNEIAAACPGMSHRVLSQRLRDLEEDGIVVRTVHDEVPVRIEYRLTPRGEALAEPVISLTAWAEHWLRDNPG
ncbi:winged helix-turn-helix transcriptional regulator [Pseudonocardia acaciae]|uniref:winged helix-turn-helix transcriptional regulator n=1 Tax=Pseudonocardia acaciae TaxID=551276 RepID=UPI000688F5B6|nr:helix-turn-helix domain-containing protein [Pseudonocardia acaciae]